MPRWILVPMFAMTVAAISPVPVQAQCVECNVSQLCDEAYYREWAICIVFASQGARYCNHRGVPGSNCIPAPEEQQALSPHREPTGIGAVSLPFDRSICKRADENAQASGADKEVTETGRSNWSPALRWSRIPAQRVVPGSPRVTLATLARSKG